jgi:hypothetical protein
VGQLEHGADGVSRVQAILFGAAAGVCALTAAIHVFLGGAKWVRPYLAVEMEPGLKWLGYLMWHLGTVSTLFLMAGFAAAALDSSRADYAMIATVGAASFVGVAVWTAVKSGVPARRFPVIPMFTLVTALGSAGLVV